MEKREAGCPRCDRSGKANADTKVNDESLARSNSNPRTSGGNKNRPGIVLLRRNVIDILFSFQSFAVLSVPQTWPVTLGGNEKTDL